MAKSYFSRYVWLVDLIHRSGYIKYNEIREAWRKSSLNPGGEELPERTFFNHKQAIEEIFGIDIEVDREFGYHIPNLPEQSGIRSWMLQSLSVNNLLNESVSLKDRVLFENAPSGGKHLEEIIEAMRYNKALFLSYKKYSDAEARSIEIEPYCVKQYRQRWYVLARCEGKMKIFSLDRIEGLEESERTFEIPSDFDAEKYFSNYFGIITKEGAGPEDVLLKVSSSQVPYLRSLPLHHSQWEMETAPEYSVFYYAMVPMYDFRKEILSMGADVEVLQPLWFRESIAGETEKMMNRYKGE